MLATDSPHSGFSGSAGGSDADELPDEPIRDVGTLRYAVTMGGKLPAEQSRAPCQSGTESTHQHQIASLNPTFAIRLIQRQRNGGG